MSFKPTLSTNLSQRLVLTPQLRQRIEMLQMTKLELSDLVTQQLAENPILEELAPDEIAVPPDLANADFSEVPQNQQNGAAELPDNPSSSVEPYDRGNNSSSQSEPSADSGDYGSASSGEGSDTAQISGENREFEGGEAGEAEIGERDSFSEIDFGSTFEEYLDPGYRTRENEVGDDKPSFEQFLSSETNLAEYLNWQLRLTITTPEVRAAAEAIIGNLNDDGYLDSPLEEIAQFGQWPMETMEKALEIVQQLDPTGVAARNMPECLLLQLKYHGYGDRLAATLIRDHFHKLQHHKWPELAKELGVSVEQIAQEMKLIRQLEPKPGRKYAPPSTHYIEPEVYIEKMDDDYIIRFNDDGLPMLRINRQYRQMMENKETSKETRDYIKDRVRSAIDLLKNIEHRKQTIYKVCERIVERQRDFLDKGIEHIKPMMLKDISEDIGMHLSTISRVVNGKYAHTPQGVIELRRFFTEGMTNDDGEEVSTQIIKLKIKKMIEAEDPREPMTDDQIASILAKEGQKLSRRTVAKYRDQMKIPGSRERRQVV
ncbi:MAG: RNA polymerase factor sigma-54 [Blastocatellales bacterium]